MRLGRRSTDEGALAEIDEKLTAARATLDECRRVEAEAEAERDRALADLAADLGLGTIDVDRYEGGRGEAEEAVDRARYERERAERVERALMARAAPLAERVAEARVAAAEGDLEQADAAVAEAELAVASCRAKRDRAADRVAVARREALDLSVPYDAAAAAKAAARRVQEDELAAWWAKEHPTTFRQEAPAELRELIAAHVDQLREEGERQRGRRREAVDGQAAEVFGDGLRPGESFRRLGERQVPRVGESL